VFKKQNLHIPEYFLHNFLFIALICPIIFFEVQAHNQNYFLTILYRLAELNSKVSSGELLGFTQLNSQLISENNDLNITFGPINDRGRYNRFQYSNPNRDSIRQIFYRRIGEIFADRNSLTFQLFDSDKTINFPRTINITNFRIDLTNPEGDFLSDDGFTQNSEKPFELGYLRLNIFFISTLGLVLGNKIIPQKFSNSVWNLVIHNLMIAWNFLVHNHIWIFIILIVLVDLVYPVTITYDSAHYLWLADKIRAEDWANWDIVRNINFPLKIFLSLVFFGYSQIGLLIPMILAHIILFTISCKLAFIVLKRKHEINRFLISFIIFTIIALDPSVVGYFHVLLTEYLVALVAMLSCFIALKLYEAQPFSKIFYLYALYFTVMVPVSWHIKQPYIGAAFFPLCISTFLILLRKFSWKKLIISFLVITSILLITLMTHFMWESFLTSQGNPMDKERHISAYTESEIGSTLEQLQQAPLQLGKRKLTHYLEIINFFIGYSSGEGRNPTLTQANENAIIAHRMYFRLGDNSFFYHLPYENYTDYLRGQYSPPIWINNIFLLRVNSSNFFFTVSYLILPFYVISIFLLWIHNKSIFSTASLILGGTSFFNAMIHLFTLPIDRYLFLGYPLNLLIIVLVFIKLISYLKTMIMSRKIAHHYFEK
jgi:hypothetical protein